MLNNRITSQIPVSDHSHRRTMLAPVAYSEAAMPSLRLTRSSRTVRTIAKLLLFGLVVSIALMAMAPWQQSVTGSGDVTAYSPNEREQVIQAPIKGRIEAWGEGIFENARVTKGQVLAEIKDLDESYSARLLAQLRNSELEVAAVQQQLQANQRALEDSKRVVESYEAQVRAYETVKVETVAAQSAYVEMAQKKLDAERQQLIEYKAAVPQLQAEYDRSQLLFKEGNLALQKVQEVERKLMEAQAKVKRAESYVESAVSELEGKRRDRTAKIEEAQVKIDYAQAMLRKANGDVSKSESDIAKTQQDVNKAQKELVEMQVKVSRQDTRIIEAPFDGYVVQITPNFGSAVLKEGDPICTIVPDTNDRSVQIWVDGNDAPLVEPGRHVRLQFEGWPAIQFAGWPSVAVGTFGGEVVSIDATDNGKGQFRVLVRPDPNDQPWPAQRYLRQGVRANGWVLLDQVPLWYEVWRRLNGFPPQTQIDSPKDDKSDKSKPPKIPKE